MSYATVEALRARYGTEIEARTDEDLAAALVEGGRIIDSWRPAGDLSAAALDVLGGHQMILARRALYPEQALDETHPIIRDASETLRWLVALAAGRVHLPTGAPGDTTASGGTGAAWSTVPTVWGRGDGGGL